jgi:hypothetical protein
VLGVWAGNPDAAFDDTHLWYRLTNAAGLGAVRNLVNEVTEDALAVALAPVVCVVDWLFGDGDCLKHAKKLADDANPTEEIDGWIPGLGDQSGDAWVGVWHFVDMNPGASNDYDARQASCLTKPACPANPWIPWK